MTSVSCVGMSLRLASYQRRDAKPMHMCTHMQQTYVMVITRARDPVIYQCDTTTSNISSTCEQLSKAGILLTVNVSIL